LLPSNCRHQAEPKIAISVGQSQISSISTLIEASSSAAVLLGFFIVPSRHGADAFVRMSEGEPTGRGSVKRLPSLNRRFKMIRKVIGAAFLAAAIIAPLAASAQGVTGGVERGSREGERAAGPVGAIVGGTIGGVVGGVSGILGVDQRPRFHRYVVEEHRPSYRYEGDVRVGAELPEAGVTYYEVPQEYGVREYRYTVVNDRPVLVDPRTHRIVQVVE
jgi:hypothetical protein